MDDWRAACLLSQTRECYGYDKNGKLIVVKFMLFKPPIISEVPGQTTEEEAPLMGELPSVITGWTPLGGSSKTFIN